MLVSVCRSCSVLILYAPCCMPLRPRIVEITTRFRSVRGYIMWSLVCQSEHSGTSALSSTLADVGTQRAAYLSGPPEKSLRRTLLHFCMVIASAVRGPLSPLSTTGERIVVGTTL